MATAPGATTFQQLMAAIMTALNLNSRELGELLGVSSRTITRYWKRGGTILPSKAAEIARKVHPVDRALATQLAALGGTTLADLGLDTAPAVRAPAALHRHVVDAVVGVAAEAMQTTPQAVRAAVTAAFERALALGMTAEEVLAALAPARPAKGVAKA